MSTGSNMDVLDGAAGSGLRPRPTPQRPRSKTEKPPHAHAAASLLKRRQSFSHAGQHQQGYLLESSEITEVSAKHFIIEQLLSSPGSLPPPLSTEQVQRNADTMDHSYIKKIPQSLITAPGPDGQLLRKGLLSGATIVFFTPGYEGKRFIYEHAKELGVSTVIIDVRRVALRARSPRALRLALSRALTRARREGVRGAANPCALRRQAAGPSGWSPRA